MTIEGLRKLTIRFDRLTIILFYLTIEKTFGRYAKVLPLAKIYNFRPISKALLTQFEISAKEQISAEVSSVITVLS